MLNTNKNVINIGFPKSLAFNLNMPEEEFAEQMFALSIIKLFELGKISSGIAAQTLSISRIDFLELASKNKVSVFAFDDEKEIEKDVNNA